MVYVPLMTAVWIAIPAFEILLACFTSDIVGTACIPWGVYSSVAAARTVPYLTVFVGYFLPLTLMIFCYSRIDHTLRTKVTATRHHALPFTIRLASVV